MSNGNGVEDNCDLHTELDYITEIVGMFESYVISIFVLQAKSWSLGPGYLRIRSSGAIECAGPFPKCILGELTDTEQFILFWFPAMHTTVARLYMSGRSFQWI